MGIRSAFKTEDYLRNAQLPQATKSYAVVPHGYIIDKVSTELEDAGLEIDKVLYKANLDARVASAVVHLKQGEDPEMRMMFAWANSYDKSMRFKCAVGAYLLQTGSILVSGNMGNWGRKHTGTVLAETDDEIKRQISKAGLYYSRLVEDKQHMKNLIIDSRKMAEIIGVLYLEHNLISIEQVSIIKQQMRKPEFKYNADKDSLWTLYCNIIYSLQKSHPKNWLDQQRMIHWFLSTEFQFLKEDINLEASKAKEESQLTIFDDPAYEETNTENTVQSL